jgi:LCP family protein required for cell wall assembly
VRPQEPVQDAEPDGEPDEDNSTRIVPGTRHTPSKEDRDLEASRIDQSLIRMTAAHAGLDMVDPGEAFKPKGDDEDDDVEDAPAPTSPGRRAGRLVIRLAVAAVALVVLAAGGVGWGAQAWLDSGVRDADALDPTSNAIVDQAAQSGDENVLIVASDRSRDPAVRADTVAVAHIPEGGGPVLVLSLPHNLQIDRPACDSWDPASAAYSTESEPAEANTQLVTALDKGGPRCVTRVVQQLTGLAVTQYVGLDLGAVENLSAAAKGVDVCVPTPVVDEALGTIVADPGPVVTLDGVRAGDYVRARAVQGEPAAELGRIERQQKFLAGMLDSLLFEPALLDIGRVTRMRPALRDALLLDGSGLDGALAVSTSLRRLDADGVTFAPVPTTGGTDGIGNAVLRDADAAALFAAVRTDQPLPAQADDPLAATAGPAPADLRVQLLNATERPGLAEQIGGTLGELGFGIGEVGNAAQPTNETIIKFSPDQAAGAEVLGASVPSATRVPDPGSNGVLQLVLGRSFDDVLRPPAAAVTPVTDPAAATPAADVPRTNCP